MLRKLMLSGVLLVLVLSMGCTLQDPRNNPSYSIFPEILLDYDFESKETKIWVKSALSDFKYDYIEFEILDNHEKQVIFENNTYCLPFSTELPEFNLTIVVKSDDKEFNFNSKIVVDQTGEYLIRITVYEKGKKTEETLDKDDLPYKKVLKEL